MSLLSKWVIIILTSIKLCGLSTAETPLFDPSLSARDVGLAKASFTDNNFNNMLKNPAGMVNTKGISIHANEFLGIDYSSILFVNQTLDITYGFHYIGSSVNDIPRSVAEGDLLKEVVGYAPYEYHALSFATAKEINDISFGVGFRYKTLVLDDTSNQSLEGFAGVGIKLFKDFKLGFSVKNFNIQETPTNALQTTAPILSSSFHYNVTKKTKLFLAIIENKNEIITSSTFHYSIEHYMNDYIPLRVGLDHNRYTFGVGLFIDPFEIDIGWAQSRSPVVNDQVTIGFSYGFEEKNHLY
ncbi:hypothetical protein DID73_01200 [Candidatus Marinamargulisbacteria bacterium SCGC AG-343-K17]|nr:hypothetical protein DID73_01200 [Candidatus Marinamargulisbacteria bacterium SCGC AG-343-K17]